MEIKKINFILTLSILVACLVLLLLVISMKLGDCDLCKFAINGTNQGTGNFMSIYSKDCFHQENTLNSQGLPS